MIVHTAVQRGPGTARRSGPFEGGERITGALFGDREGSVLRKAGLGVLLLVLALGAAVGQAAAPTAAASGDPSISVSPGRGPLYGVVTVTGSGFDPQSSYYFCFDATAASSPCGSSMALFSGPSSFLNSSVGYATGSDISSGVRLIVPAERVSQSENYSIDVFSTGTSAGPVASVPFELTLADLKPTVSAGSGGSMISVSGGGMLPSTTYVYCILSGKSIGLSPCPSGSPTFTTDARGNFTGTASIQVPAQTPSGNYGLGYEQQGTGAVTFWNPFTLKGSSIVFQLPPSNSLLYEIVYVAVIVAAAALIASLLLLRRRKARRRATVNEEPAEAPSPMTGPG